MCVSSILNIMQMSASVFSRSRWLAACSTSTSIAASPGTPDALMHLTIQRWKALDRIVRANSTSDSAGMTPSARWAAETTGPIEETVLAIATLTIYRQNVDEM